MVELRDGHCYFSVNERVKSKKVHSLWYKKFEMSRTRNEIPCILLCVTFPKQILITLLDHDYTQKRQL